MHEEKCKNKTRTAAWFGERETTEKNELEHDLVHEEKRHDLVHNEDHKKTRTVARLGERKKNTKEKRNGARFRARQKNVILWCSFWMGV